MRITNTGAYPKTVVHKTVTIKIEVMLDAVPGAWHDLQDFIDWLLTYKYVLSLETDSEKETTGNS